MPTRRLTQDEKVGVLESLTGGLSEVFGDTRLLFTDRAGFIAGAGGSSPITEAVREASRFQCRSFARNPGQFSAAAGNYLGDVCDPYLKGIGEDPLPAVFTEPSVTGGQCPGVLYDCIVNANQGGTGNPVTIPFGVRRGPIRSRPAPGAPPEPLPTAPNITHIEFVDQGLNPIATFSSRTQFPVNPQMVCTPVEPEPPGGCGDKEPDYDPPRPRPGLPALPPTINVNLPGVGPVEVGLTLAPDGTVTVSIPELGIEASLTVGSGGDGGDGDGGDGGSPPPPGDAGEPGAPAGTGEGGEADGEAPEGSVLVGLRIDFASPPIGGTEYAPGVYRGVCYVYMGTAAGLDHDPAGAMLRSGQFVFAEKANLTRWRVSANRGYNLNVTPYYREVTTESE